MNPKEDISYITNRANKDSGVKVVIKCVDTLPARINKGDKLGTAYVVKDGVVVSEVVLCAANDYKKEGFMYYLGSIFQRWTQKTAN